MENKTQPLPAAAHDPARLAPDHGRKMGDRIGDWIQTYLGVQFYPLDPQADEIRLVDIAHALSNICRFTGHCREFYSVAQHSVLVSRICAPEDAAWGLLHDAPEAYISDLSRPIKRHSRLGSEYKNIENVLMFEVCKKFSLPQSEPASVKRADNVALMTEKRDLMPNSPHKWAEVEIPLEQSVRPCWTPDFAKHQFLQRASELGIL